MVHLLRRYQQPIMAAVTVVIIIAFVWMFNGRLDNPLLASKGSLKIYDRYITQLEIEKRTRVFAVAERLGLIGYLSKLAGNARTMEQAVSNFVINSFIVDHEAEKLGIEPTPEEMVAAVKELPVFHTNGQFDPSKYGQFVAEVLAPNGFTEQQLESLVREDLRLKKLSAVIESTTDLSPAAFQKMFVDATQKVKTEVIRFSLEDFTRAVNPSAEEIKAYYDKHSENLKTDEKRVVSFVEFTLSESERDLQGPQRRDRLTELSNKARDFGQALLRDPKPSFADAAKEFGVEVKTTGEFTVSAPPADFKEFPRAAASAFQLTETDAHSEAEFSETGYIIMHLEKVIPPRPLTLEEATPRIVEAIKREQGQNALTSKANEVHAKLSEALTAGKSFSEAATEAGVTPEALPPFSLLEPPQTPEGQIAARTIATVKEKGISPVVPSFSGSLIFYIAERLPVDSAALEKGMQQDYEVYRSMDRSLTFAVWLNHCWTVANPHRVGPQLPVGEEG